MMNNHPLINMPIPFYDRISLVIVPNQHVLSQKVALLSFQKVERVCYAFCLLRILDKSQNLMEMLSLE
jgi:hypothetical protein